jgi:membrane protein DedA with SNARE-associated domain
VIDLLGAVLASPSPKPLPGVFNHFTGTLHHYGYFAVAFSLFFENTAVPLPGQLVLIAAALYAATGQLNIVAVCVVAVVASTAGSALGYAIGQFGGRPLAEKYGKYVLLTAERLDRVERFFARRGWLVVLLGRFVEGVRQANAVIAGLSAMTFRRFIAFSAAGSVIWVAVWATVGEAAGSHVTTISKYAGYVAAALGIAAVLFVVAHLVSRSRRRRRAVPTAGPSGS